MIMKRVFVMAVILAAIAFSLRIDVASATMSDEDFVELCRHGDADEIMDAISSGANVNARGSDGEIGSTALIRAVATVTPNTEVIKILLEHGADVNAKDGYSDYEWTALMFAVDYGGRYHGYTDREMSMEIVKILFEYGADANAKGSDGQTALLLFADSYFAYLDPEVAKLLLEHGADVNAKDSNGQTALMLLADDSYYGLQAVKILIENGADVDARDNDDMTALIIAAREGNADDAEIVQALLRAGADVDAQDSNGFTALSYAVNSGKNVIAKALREKGAR
jgi:ankyrin repeat protein